jgi:hypothetical protein
MLKRIVYEACYLAGSICEDIDNFCLKVLLCPSGEESELKNLAKKLRNDTREEWIENFSNARQKEDLKFAVLISSVEKTPWVLRVDEDLKTLEETKKYPVIILMAKDDYGTFAKSNPVSDSIAQLFSFH